MEFSSFKTAIEKLCLLNFQMDSEPNNEEWEVKIGRLNKRLAKQDNVQAMRDCFMVDAQQLEDELGDFFAGENVKCVINRSSNGLIISIKEGEGTTYCIEGDAQSDKIILPMYHITGSFACLIHNYPTIYNLFWNMLENNFNQNQYQYTN